jgi:hypothetical protein
MAFFQFFDELFGTANNLIESPKSPTPKEEAAPPKKPFTSWSLLPEDSEPHLKPELRELMRERRMTRQTNSPMNIEKQLGAVGAFELELDQRIDEIMAATTNSIIDFLMIQVVSELEAEEEMAREEAEAEAEAKLSGKGNPRSPSSGEQNADREVEKAAIMETMRRRSSSRRSKTKTKTNRRRSLSSPPERSRSFDEDEDEESDNAI